MFTNSINFATIYILFSVIDNKLKNVWPLFNRITIKVGSNVITQEDGSLNESRILSVVEDIAVLYKQEVEVLLISSGAVSAGRGDLDYLAGLCSESEVINYDYLSAYGELSGKYPSSLLRKETSDSFGTEFLSYVTTIKTVTTFEDAQIHISEYGSKHSEAIISENINRIQLFYKLVDASSVYSNTSTAFTDGAQFGLGAEIGVSTRKQHARGPIASEALTTYK